MASATQKDLDICEVDQDVLDKYKKFRFRRKENPAAMICMPAFVHTTVKLGPMSASRLDCFYYFTIHNITLTMRKIPTHFVASDLHYSQISFFRNYVVLHHTKYEDAWVFNTHRSALQ